MTDEIDDGTFEDDDPSTMVVSSDDARHKQLLASPLKPVASKPEPSAPASAAAAAASPAPAAPKPRAASPVRADPTPKPAVRTLSGTIKANDGGSVRPNFPSVRPKFPLVLVLVLLAAIAVAVARFALHWF
jgi:hypothetical protein